ncbi:MULTISPECIES: hypothetical protein [Acinetobacter]|uniref:hypothetical protein n=1 Tax=Acinetobacter TaxID=469 RepID=UPI00141B4EC5|nr:MULTISPECIES: hypothetical protein [Acinetobacter]MCS4298907.1 hypothetical protein [Acinetobacter guillouiae]MCW2252355.1 hypothetical protein [Acinetobacter sp. BIGb0204]NII38058.1 hypothetical protein [Acinetobacter sp. BIGb0196]
MKKMNLCLALSLTVLASCPVLAQAKAKSAVCQIDEGGKIRYKGKCNFEPQGGGSFYISHPNITQKLKVAGLTVMIEKKDQAIVEATKLSGGGSIWGEAYRSQQQKACWVGSDFKICVW